MNKKIWLIIVLVFVALMLVVLLLSLFVVRRRLDIAQIRGDELYEIYGERKVGQSFVAHKDNLSMVVLDLRNAMLKNKQPISFHLREMNNVQDLREIKISGLNVGDPSSVRFQFEPIFDSAGKSYYFYVESPSSLPEDAVEIFHSSKDVYSEGEMMVNGQAIFGDLRFMTIYYPGSKIAVVRETINDFVSRFLSDRSFVFIYLILLLLTFSLGLMI